MSLSPQMMTSSADSLRAYLANWPKTLTDLDRFLLALRLGEYNNPSLTDLDIAPTSSFPPPPPDDDKERIKNLPSKIKTINRSTLANKALELIRSIIGTTKWTTGAELLTILEGLGKEFHTAYSKDPCLSNVVRRIMNEVRKEVEMAHSTRQQSASSQVPLSVSTVSLDPSSDSALSPPNVARAPSMTSMMFNHGGDGAGDSRDLLDRGIERFRSDSVVSGDSCDSNNGDDNSGREGGGKKKKQPKSPLRAKSESVTLSGGAKKLPHFYHEVNGKHFTNNIMESIQEVLGELDESNKAINDQSSLHIHSNETILTYSSSKTILSFLISAHHKGKRRFKVIVAEGAPHYGGHVMASKLAGEGIPVTVIHDAAIPAMMPRVDCLLLPAHAVLANGGVVGPSGSHLCALAAKANKVSTIVVSGLGFKLCPMYPHEGQDTYQDLISPAALLPKDISSTIDFENDSLVDLISPVHDYISPDLVSLFVTNIGGFEPSYVYRLLVELYDPADPIVFN